MLPASEINSSNDSICAKGGYLSTGNRPGQSASLTSFDIPTMGILYQRWEDFTAQNEEVKESVMSINCCDYRKVREVKDQDSAFAWTARPINVLQVSVVI